jgi:hypothetical protein
MWGLLGFLLLISNPNCLLLHDERELGAIKDGSWIEFNITMISQKIAK